MALKASVPGTNVIEAQFTHVSEDWQSKLERLADVQSVHSQSGGMYRVLSNNGSRTTTQLVQLAAEAGAEIKSLSVQNTTLDDVFVHFTGRQLRDEQVKAFAYTAAYKMQP
jgi:ABC-2 type transport system ATP-binding protein